MSHAQAPSAAVTSGWRFQLRELLWLILLAALGLGWWRDHQQQATRAELYERQIGQLLERQGASVSATEQVLRQYEHGIREYREELNNLRQERLAWVVRPPTGAALSPPPAPEEFVRIVASGDQNEYHKAIQSFGTSAYAHEGIPGLLPLLADSSHEVRRMALQSLGRIRGHSETAVPAIIPLLDDPERTVNMAALLALRARGAAARQAIPALTAKMNDSGSPLAVQAALALKDIDPSADVSKRLVELLDSPLADVRVAAILHLEFHVGREEIERLLTAMYPGEHNETVRRAIANTLNRISRFAPASE